MTSIDISGAIPADAADVIRLFGALHEANAELDPRFALADGWQDLVEEYLRQSQEAEDSMWLLARNDNHAIGFVLVEVHMDSPLYKHRRWAEIVGLYVDPAHRGGNIAHRLMDRAFTWAAGHNLKVMQLYVTATNQEAQHFYHKQGFYTTQHIMRRVLSEVDEANETAHAHPSHRLHFSEGGARPLDMHEHRHDV